MALGSRCLARSALSSARATPVLLTSFLFQNLTRPSPWMSTPVAPPHMLIVIWYLGVGRARRCRVTARRTCLGPTAGLFNVLRMVGWPHPSISDVDGGTDRPQDDVAHQPNLRSYSWTVESRAEERPARLGAMVGRERGLRPGRGPKQVIKVERRPPAGAARGAGYTVGLATQRGPGDARGVDCCSDPPGE